MDMQLLEGLCRSGMSQRAISKETGLSHTAVRYWLKKYGLRTPATGVAPSEWPVSLFEEACGTSISVGEVLDKIGASKCSANYRRAKWMANHLGVELPNGNLTGANNLRRGAVNVLSIEEIRARFIRRSRPGNNRAYKRWMLRLGVEEACSQCGLGACWNDVPLTLELDHVDGDSLNFEWGNLRLLCPNCHSQQATTNRHKVALLRKSASVA